MGTLEQQQEKYEEALAFVANLQAPDVVPIYKLSEGDKRQYGALFNQASHGAFRHAPPETKQSLGTREKQQWEALGNITKVEAMKRYVEKSEKIKVDFNLALNAAKHQ